MSSFKNLTGVYDQKVPGHYETDEYVFFWAGPFSNWHAAEFSMPWREFQNHKFNCSEQAMMWLKADLFGDEESKEKILKSKDPKKQKELGRAVKGYVEEEWVAVRQEYSDYFLLRKFAQNDDLLLILLETGTKTIVEASPYDTIWGIGMGVNNYPEILDRNKWRGLNLLGESLMRVRTILSNPSEYTEYKMEGIFIDEVRSEIDNEIINEILKSAKL